ncbi:MAG: hypothetical protein ACJA0N_002748 [Pseudohongiellaceae bacterium]|jgi:hypothetical protein
MNNNTINRFKLALGALTLLVASSAATASIIVLDFEGIGDQANINDFYNGGTDSDGNSGVDFGISFGSDALGLIDIDVGGSGNTANEPSGETAMFFLTGTAILNYAAGFDTGFSFFYSAGVEASVNVFDGLDGTGNLLASLDLGIQNNDSCSGDPTGFYCNWTAVGASFVGTAVSIDFGGTANFVIFDDITFGSSDAGDSTDVPAPASFLLMTLGLGLLVRNRKRQS